MVFLVTGGSGNFGSQLITELRKRNHIVYAAQRNKVKSEDIEYNLEYWKKIDFEDPSEIALLVQSLLKIPLDGIAFMHRSIEAISSNNLGPFDVEHAIRINATTCLILIRYLLRFEVLKKDGIVVLPLDKTNVENKNMPYRISKAILPNVVEIGLEDLDIKRHYVELEDSTDRIADLLDKTEESRERVIKCQKR